MRWHLLLEAIRDPRQLDDLDSEQLGQLAQEIRTFLIQSVSRTGGHLSPNLGVVELTLALHRVFESPKDVLVWDTGHQAYVHKLLTGRAQGFSTLRQAGGLSGYPSRSESDHDFVENSHASTSLSYALGIAQAKLRKGDEGKVIAVIGDGALTGGLAFEALNQISHLQPPNLLIIVNDNGRSYAPTVGGLAKSLSRIRVDKRYSRAKEEISQWASDLPVVGATADEAARRIKESLKALVHNANMFESLGLKYTGPADGHDIAGLEEIMRKASQLDEPVVIHTVTDKGRGYEPAIADEVDRLHGVSTFDPDTGPAVTADLTLTDVFGEALLSVGERRRDVCAITAAMASSTGLLEFEKRYPDRFFDVGICEQHAATFAAGLAMGGMHPVIAIYSTFAQRAMDQLILDVGMHDLPVVLVLDRSGVTGPDGASHHGLFDLSYLRMIPNFSVAAPRNGAELCALLETAVTMDGPCAIRYPKGAASEVPKLPAEALPVGVWEELEEGSDVAFLAVGRMVDVAVKAAHALADDGISGGVINARWIKPLDERLEQWALSYGALITVEDGVVTGGFGSAVLEALAPAGLAGKISMVALPDAFQQHGSPNSILAEHGLDVGGLVETARAAVKHRNPADQPDNLLLLPRKASDGFN